MQKFDLILVLCWFWSDDESFYFLSAVGWCLKLLSTFVLLENILKKKTKQNIEMFVKLNVVRYGSKLKKIILRLKLSFLNDFLFTFPLIRDKLY